MFLQTVILSQKLIVNPFNRNSTSLNGAWNYIIDPYENGYYNFRQEAYDQQKNSSNAAFYNNYHAKNKQELVEYDFDKSPVMTIPNDWNSQKPELLYYEGTIWFKKSFDYYLKDKRRLFLYFGAVNYKAEIYLNGQKLGVHEGGFTPFNFEISAIVKTKDNYLVVKADNTRRKDGVPTVNTDWWNYGGITRDVLLIEENETFVEDYKVQFKKGVNNLIAGFVKINNPQKEEKITVSIPELKIEKEITSASIEKTYFEVKAANVEYWSPENPKLYDVLIKTDSETIKDKIGFRTIETVGPDILLNGKSIFLKGISIHEENATGGRGSTEADALRLLNWAKELGCNYVRLAHYPHNENMVRLADKMGLLVWEEIPVYWTVDFTNENVLQNAKNQLTEVITRDNNRASIIIWSIANETPQSEARNNFLINLVNHTKSLDSTRLVSAALLTRNINGVGTIDDKIGDSLDIVAFNEYLGWYGGNLADANTAKWATPYNKPVVVSEFGGDAKQGLHGTREERWTEEYQEYLYQQNLLMIEKMPNIRGLSPWILVDFRSPRRVLPEIQDGYNRKGLISDKGAKKKAFFTLKDFYNRIGKKYELVWADEFNYSGKPDPKKWGYETGFVRNNESQYYTDRKENARVENGNLVIEARQERFKNKEFTSITDKNWRFSQAFTEYTSASLTTKDKADWTYGKIEVRAKLPKGTGSWSAIWMLSANWKEVGWAKCGEIDIMENVGFEPNTIHGTIHTQSYNYTLGTQKSGKIEVEKPADTFHLYSIEWNPERIDFLVDGVIYNTFINEHKSTDEWAFDQNFHLKINTAIGGDWGRQNGIDEKSFPQKMFIDYVRVYQLK
ncbi:MAG: glycoside hydrolase family 2 TIM barrel-domain containing protein [Actinomycetota bacterium]